MKTKDLNARIRALCAERGMKFKPWEITPWDVDEGECPYPPGNATCASWPKAQKLRRALIQEIERQVKDL